MTTWIVLTLITIWIGAMIYVYIVRRKPVDWVRILVTQGSPDWRHLYDKASCWKTCPTGMYYTGIKFDDGEPMDEEVMKLGLNFTDAISHRNAKLALEIIDQIQRKDRMKFVPADRVREAKVA